jgi:hypothetical protein
VTLKIKYLLAQMLDDGCEEECKEFYQPFEGLYISCLEYLNVWVKQYDELPAFCCLSLSDFTSQGAFQLAIQYVLSKGVHLFIQKVLLLKILSI